MKVFLTLHACQPVVGDSQNPNMNLSLPNNRGTLSNAFFFASKLVMAKLCQTYGKNWDTQEELLPRGHQAPKLKLCLITSTWLNLINSKIFTILYHPYCCCLYPVQHVCTFLLHIPAYIIVYVHSILSCTFYSLFYYYIFCTVHWADLTWLTFHYWLYSV